ncbi:WD40/YVTN/BNR-like repeat-containing protein [Kribbella flavida]|nr:hypothetical protein [Kribbella flavida]
MSTDQGANYELQGPAPQKGITSGFAVPSEQTVAVSASAADQCVVYLTFDGGANWEETLTVTDGAPASNLTFTDANHGSVTCGWDENAMTYYTEDAGRTWMKM